ncbi:hypothetical protein B0I27_101239 [Arcticibacter pallidicorallinus]|uniref:Uncharacterized protein n=1 Tax=Arcticibacter pallidicorallinus TaxID=1259464 RepID=A0A2T0UBF2_9SPHI|nr:hypothetical protein [Arcticibacter pallidicorallinus]PRY55270.1 hypothetical protein B0I27_101239 [Arcticibacter pallidicorallinus]
MWRLESVKSPTWNNYSRTYQGMEAAFYRLDISHLSQPLNLSSLVEPVEALHAHVSFQVQKRDK